MATPRAVARNLRRSAQRIDRARSEIVADAATYAIEEASVVGGSFAFGTSRPYRMYGSVTKVSNRGTATTATVHGIPVGAWAMKSNGRRGGYDVGSGEGVVDLRGAGLPISAAASVRISRGTSGDGRWDRVRDAVTARLPTIAEEMISEALDG